MDASTLKWTKRGTWLVVAALMSFPTWELRGQSAQPARQFPPAELTKPAAVQIEMSDGRWLRREISAQAVGSQKVEDASPSATASSALPLWDAIMFEGFEAPFPAANNWAIRYESVAPYFWDDVSYNPRTGALSGWCAGGAASGNPILNPATNNYVNNMNSAMVFGPFNLSGATDARLDFWYWLDSQPDYDFLIWVASTSPSGPFYGFQTSGSSGGIYKLQSFDLKSVPTLGNLLGRSQVYIAFVYQSDFTLTYKGAFLDDIFLLKQPGTTVNKADLVPYRVYLRTGPNGGGTEVSTPVLGQQYYVHFDWRNEGPVAANNFRWEIKLNGAVLCANNNQSASPNTSYTSSCQTALIWNCQSGANNLEAVMDVTEVIDEAGETNNAVSQSYICPLPDLAADRIYLRTGPNAGAEVDNPVAGQSYYLHFDWRNRGSVAGDSRLELKLNNVATCFYNSGTVPANSSQKSWCASPIIWPTSATPIFIEGALDVGNVISEGDENNNVVSRQFPPNQTAQPNLVPTVLTFSPAAVNAGGALNLSGTVTNNGTGSTGNAFNISFYLSTSSSAPDVNLPVHTFTMSALGAGQSNNFTQTGTVPANTTPGSYYVWIRVDVNGAIFESNETDNQLRTNTLLAVIVNGAQIRPVVGATQTIGSEFNVEVEVNNVQNLFGVSFELNYTNTVYVNVVGTPTAGEFMGNDPIFFPTVDEAAGKVSIGVSHKAGQTPSSGSGVVARIRFTSLNTTPNNTPVLFSLSAVSANDPSGNPLTLTPSSLPVTLIGGIPVWPGDTNNDGIVNQADVLPIGLHWGRTGPARQPPSMIWSGQIAQQWNPMAATYADANGDGTINQADVLPIGLNWNRTHTVIPAAPLVKAEPISSATLVPEINSALTLDQEFFIRMNLAQATDVFGLAFELLYDRPDMLQILSVEPDESFGANVVFYSKADNAAGKIAVGISRKAGQESVYGSASAVRIKAKFSANARLGETIAFSLANVSANDSNGRPIAIYAQASRLTIGATTAVAAENATQLVADYRLHQNSPNPFNPETLIRYELPDAGPVLLKVYNFTGQEVRTLVNSFQQRGSHQITWDGRDAQGRDLPSGTYLYRLQSGSFSETRKMVLLR